MKKQRRIWSRSLFGAAKIILVGIGGCSLPRINLFSDGNDPLSEQVLEGSGQDKVLVIPIRGTITDMPEQGLLRSKPDLVRRVVSHLKKAEKDSHIKAVILRVDSPGGTVTASDMIYHELMEFKKKTGVKIVAAMMNLAASGGYYVSLPADFIMAHPTTVTGSVGVIFSRPVVAGLMDKIGVHVNVSKTGQEKDMGSPFREASPEEQKIIQDLVDRLGNRFMDLVRKHRKPDPEALKTIATARIFLAEEAKTLGLVDEIGYLNDALAKAKSLAGLSEDAKVVIYRRAEYPDDNIYNTAGVNADNPVTILDVNLPISPLPAGFYYMWPSAANFQNE